MANELTGVLLGIDVSKDSLVIHEWGTGNVYEVANEVTALEAWFEQLQGPVQVALEPTSTYHLLTVAGAVAHGYQVYLVNPRQLHHYRASVGLRHKSDAHDAELLARYLAHERPSLRVHQPLDGQAQQLWTLVKRRGMLVQMRKTARQSLKSVGLDCTEMLASLGKTIARADRMIEKLLVELGWWSAYELCRSIPGVGAVTAAALVTAYHRGVFANADAFVAYLGLDVKLRDSGLHRGRRKLSKHGEAELRRVLFCASHPARHEPRFDAYYQKQLAKGLPKTAARMILGRKLVRIAFALLSRGETYRSLPQVV